MSGQLPQRMTYQALGAVMLDITERVRQGDSLEGFIEWALPYDDDAAGPDDVDVTARFRYGNLEHGQGFMHIIGTIPTTTTSTTTTET
jgi:hypothetical protein